MLPSPKRMKKVSLYAVGGELILYMVFASTTYICFGDKFTSNLIILREPYQGKVYSEYFFFLCITLFMILTNLGLSMFNPGMRDYLKKFVFVKNE